MLTNGLLCGFIDVPEFGFRGEENFDPLVSEDTFHRVQRSRKDGTGYETDQPAAGLSY